MKQPTTHTNAKLGAVTLVSLGFLLLVAIQAQLLPASAQPALAYEAVEPTPTPSPVMGESKQEVVVEEKGEVETKTAKITAYSCGGLTEPWEIDMNCPSLWGGEPKTANGTKPIPYKTMACDKANMGRVFEIEGYGEVTCTDTGGAIQGAGRFDLYVKTVDEARQFGVQYREYREVK